MGKRPGVTDGCLLTTIPLMVVVFVGTLIFGVIFGAPLIWVVKATLGVAFVMVIIMLVIEIFTGIFHIDPPPDDQQKTP